MTLLRSFALALALLLVPVAVSAARKPPEPTPPGQAAVTLTATPNPVTFSSPETIKVSVKRAKAGVSVVLQRHLTSSTTFTDVETKLTDAKGDAIFTTRPAETTYYRAIARTTPEATSAEQIVKVAPLVGFKVGDATPRAGRRVRFSGTVRPRHDGRRVYVQRKLAGSTAFTTVRRTTLRAATAAYSRYALRVRVRRTATYRVRILGHTDHSMGISRERTLTVH